MSMFLGNDVVNLASPNAREKSRDRRFVNKVLTPAERCSLNLSPNPDTALWQYWAAKESAYKALSRYDPSVSSVPRRYEVIWVSSAASWRHGFVRIASHSLPATCWFNGKRLLCLCFCSASPTILKSGIAELAEENEWDHNTTTEAQSRIVRDKAIRSLSTYLNCPRNSMTIRRLVSRDGHLGPPLFFLNEEPIPVPLSLSHDGPAVYYAWCADTRYFTMTRNRLLELSRAG